MSAGDDQARAQCAASPAALIRKRFDWQRLLPRYWYQNNPTDWIWDAVLNRALDHFEPRLGCFTCKIGPLNVWIGNWPYAYGYNHGRSEGLPSVATRKRLRARISLAIAEQSFRELDEAIRS